MGSVDQVAQAVAVPTLHGTASRLRAGVVNFGIGWGLGGSAPVEPKS